MRLALEFLVGDLRMGRIALLTDGVVVNEQNQVEFEPDGALLELIERDALQTDESAHIARNVLEILGYARIPLIVPISRCARFHLVPPFWAGLAKSASVMAEWILHRVTRSGRPLNSRRLHQ